MVPNTANATRLAVTPGMKKAISTIAPAGSRFGFPDAAIFALVLRWNRLKTMIAVSKNLCEVNNSVSARMMVLHLQENEKSNRETSY